MRNGSGLAYDVQGSSLYVRPITSSGCPPVRTNIRAFSIRSGARMRRYLRCCDAEYSVLATLTYPAEFPSDGRAVKRHLRAFIERVRRYHNGERPDWSIFWFLEFQKRGAPHFHIYTNYELPREMVAMWWYEIVGSGDRKHLLAGTRIERLRGGREGAIGYATKYAAKLEQKEVPAGYESVGRFWGACGLVSCHSVFVLVPFDALLSETHKKMKMELRRELLERPGGWKRMNFGERGLVVRGITMMDSELRERIERILKRYGLLLMVRNPETVVEYPELEWIGDLIE